MDLMTISIENRDMVGFKCSHCGYKAYIDLSHMLSIYGRIYKIKCKCNNIFCIICDRRRHRRKLCNLIGTYTIPNTFIDNIINIIDLSTGGLRFTRSDNNKLDKNDRIHIRFNLNNAENDLIECTAIVRNQFNNTVSVQFEEMNARMQTTLGFYFLPVTVKLEMSHPQFPGHRRDTSHPLPQTS